MAFGSNDFPLGPNGQFPRQRIGNFDNRIAPPNRVEDVYRRNRGSKLPVVEKEFSSSVEKVKRRMKMGREMRKNQRADKFRPQYTAEELEMSGMGAVNRKKNWYITRGAVPKKKVVQQPQYRPYASSDIYVKRPGEAF